MFYDETKSEIFEEEWDKSTKDIKVDLISQYIVIGQEGAALQVECNPFLTKWYNVPESVPHITLLINENFKDKDLGPMMKTASTLKWDKTDSPLIFQSPGANMIKILCGTSMFAKPQEAILMPTQAAQTTIETKQVNVELMEDMLGHVPDVL